jgi:hypothetical protein
LLNGVMGVLFAIFAMLAISPTGQEFFPSTDPRLVNVNIEGPIGMNIIPATRPLHTLSRSSMSCSKRMRRCGPTLKTLWSTSAWPVTRSLAVDSRGLKKR